MRFSLSNLSLRLKFVIVVSFTLLPLAALLLGVIVLAYLPVYHTMENVVHHATEEMATLNNLERSLLQIQMPPNDYIIHGGAEERELFMRFARDVDSSLAQMDGVAHSEQDRASMARVGESWKKARTQAEKILSQPIRPGDPALSSEMESFDGNMSNAVEALLPVLQSMRKDIEAELVHTQHLRKVAVIVTQLAFLLALILGIGASLMLTRDRRELKALSETDALTGLHNRRGFDKKLSLTSKSMLEFHNSTLSLIMVDIDHFKKVNDTHGHESGDRVLSSVAALLKQEARSRDFVCRYGGEEFAVIVPNAAAPEAHGLAERLRKSIEATEITLEDGTVVRVTISLGCASAPGDADTPEALQRAADQALYAAKHSGRNRVCAFNKHAAETAV